MREMGYMRGWGGGRERESEIESEKKGEREIGREGEIESEEKKERV